MNFYYDQKQKSIYLTSNRNGSTLLMEIASTYSHLVDLPVEKIFEYLNYNPEMPIYCAFRDPYVRFVSGLRVQFDVATGLQFNHPSGLHPSGYGRVTTVEPQPEKITAYKNMLTYIKNRSQSTGTIHTYPTVPYHLYDEHLDHWLWAPALLGSYGFNIKLIPMNEFSNHLTNEFPKAFRYIKARERSNSFDRIKPYDQEIWDAYKEIMIDTFEWGVVGRNTDPDILVDYDKWMAVERYIFDKYRQHHAHPNPTPMFVKLFDRIMDDPYYTSDILAPRVAAMNFLISEIHRHVPNKPRVKKMNDIFQTIRNNTVNFTKHKY